MRGTIAYSFAGGPSGREYWTLTRAADGCETLRVTREIDRIGLVGDTVFTVDADGRPLEALVHRSVEGAWIGSAAYIVRGDSLEARLWGPGRETEVVQVAVPARFSLVIHPVFLDGWQFLTYDRAVGGEQTVFVVNSSTRPDGGDGPLVMLHENRLDLVAEDDVISVAGGTHKADHFRLMSSADFEPRDVAIDLWMTRDTHLMLRMDWKDYGGRWEVVDIEAYEPCTESGSD